MQDNESFSKDTLYYDGSCPLCTAEVCKLAKHAGDKLALQNIHELESDSSLPSKTRLLERLHIRTANGDWLVGMEANVRAWHHTPYAPLWRVLNWPVIRRFSAAAYELWLLLRRKRQLKIKPKR